MTKRHLIIATRQSPLALKQSEWVKTQLQKIYPHLAVDFLGITTQADKMLEMSLTQIGGKGLFIKELEEALLQNRADIAVHSMKDVPMDLPPGLSMPVICVRDEVRDVLVSNLYSSLGTLPNDASIGTSSLRRETQLKALRSDLTIRLLRGNVNTRLARLDQGDFDALILAGAGLKRLDLGNRIRSYFSVEEILPAAGQGALGIECKSDDDAIQKLIAPLNDPATNACVTAERAICRHLEGGCSVPIGAYGEIHHGVLHVRGLVANRSGMKILRAKNAGDPKNAEEVGARVAEELLQRGAKKILAEFRG